jgi:hypothetical protein
MKLKDAIKLSFEKCDSITPEIKQEHLTFYIFELAFQLGFNYAKNNKMHPIEFYHTELFENDKMKSYIKNQFNISDDKYNQLLNEFYLEKSAINSCYPDMNSLFKHCINYLGYKIKNQTTHKPASKTNSSKLL